MTDSLIEIARQESRQVTLLFVNLSPLESHRSFVFGLDVAQLTMLKLIARSLVNIAIFREQSEKSIPKL